MILINLQFFDFRQCRRIFDAPIFKKYLLLLWGPAFRSEVRDRVPNMANGLWRPWTSPFLLKTAGCVRSPLWRRPCSGTTSRRDVGITSPGELMTRLTQSFTLLCPPDAPALLMVRVLRAKPWVAL